MPSVVVRVLKETALAGTATGGMQSVATGEARHGGGVGRAQRRGGAGGPGRGRPRRDWRRRPGRCCRRTSGASCRAAPGPSAPCGPTGPPSRRSRCGRGCWSTWARLVAYLRVRGRLGRAVRGGADGVPPAGAPRRRGRLGRARPGASGPMFCASMFASRTFAEMAAATAGPRWLQLYWLRDRDAFADVLARAEQAGFGALVLTVDAPAGRHPAARPGSSFTLPDDVRAVNLDPAADGQRAHRPPAASAIQQHSRERFDPTITWADLPWLRAGPPAAAAQGRAHRRGRRGWRWSTGSTGWSSPTTAAGSWTRRCRASRRCRRSSRGAGRDAGAGRRRYPRGSDVFAALALGARAVLIGRPALWGLAVGRTARTDALRLLRDHWRSA